VEAVGDGRATLKYLAPYVYRVAISNNRIHAVDASSVTYRFTPGGSQNSVTRRVPGQEFVRGFLQHSLPRNFQRLRYYGFASQNSKLSIGWVRMLVWFYLGWCYVLARQAAPKLSCTTLPPQAVAKLRQLAPASNGSISHFNRLGSDTRQARWRT